MLDAVTYEIAGLRNHESLIILIFTDRKISKNFTEIWHENKASDTVYAFRVGSKESKDMAQNELFLRLTKCKADKKGSKTREQDTINALRSLNVQTTQDLIQTTTLRANIQNTQTATQSTSKPSTEFITISSSRLTTPTRDPFATTSRTTREMTSTPNPSILSSIITTPMTPTVPTASLQVFTKKSTKSTPPHPTLVSPAKTSTTPVNIFKKFKMFNPELALNEVSTLKPTFTRSPSFQRQSQTIKAGVPLNSQASSKKPFVRGSSSDCNLDVIFLVDFSQGTGDKSPRYLEIAASAVDQMPLEERGVRVGLMKYSAHADVLVKLKDGQNKDDVIKCLFLTFIQYFMRLREMLKSRQAGGTTKSGEAINVAAKQFTERGRRKTLVLFTDGYSQDDVSLAAMEAKRSGIRIVVVTVEDDRIPADSVQLKMIASSPDALLASPKGSELRNLIINPFCRN
ncbi:hypothetical protein WR25_16543 [Diploscapter pachys]|uniref:VWFA domain-containing protein n=1 Tax=Diploscapter pachys TaxID=2018661 RepID=A0A2A2JTS8_9BILA|nr:hypothetical protein WR25_16543 [Diploscapter pachys]